MKHNTLSPNHVFLRSSDTILLHSRTLLQKKFSTSSFSFPSLHTIPLFCYPSSFSCQNTQSHTCWRQCPDVYPQLFSCGINIFLFGGFRFVQLLSQPIDMLFCGFGMRWWKQSCLRPYLQDVMHSLRCPLSQDPPGI